ncbi:unnamed protein product [Cuscuta europaea]|uniref:FAR1 domain-containing protein n=1 Tax=Cuscuta europaea TaxID=41803 RepID=A0A9P0ZUG6_CUSEU|nr:unnamed protein product [Cuscuta europaea]
MDDVTELDGEIQQNESDDGSIKAPDVGMEFDSKEAVCDFYKTYGKRLEFPVRTLSATKHKNGNLTQKPPKRTIGEGEEEIKC